MPTREALKVWRTSTVADGLLDLLGLEQALHRRAQLLDDLVDDRVAADLDALALAATWRASPTGRTLKPMMTASEAAASITSDSLMPPTPSWITLHADLLLRQLGDLVRERLERAGHVGLDHQVELGELALLGAREHVLERDPARPARRASASVFRRLARSPASGRASRSFSTTRTCSPASGTPSKPSTSTGSPGVASLTRSPRKSCIARTRPQWAPATSASPTLQRAALDEQRDHGAAARVEPRLDHRAGGLGVRVGLQLLESASVTSVSSRLVEVLRVLADTSTNSVSPPQSAGRQALLGQLAAHAVGVRALLVDLVDRDDDRHARRPWRGRSPRRSAASRRRRRRRRSPRCR